VTAGERALEQDEPPTIQAYISAVFYFAGVRQLPSSNSVYSKVTVAVSSSPNASGLAPAERLQFLRELGARAVPTWAALDSPPGGRAQLVVVERGRRGESFDDEEIGDWVRDARRLATLDHPNVARVRDVIIRSDEVLVVSEFVDGVRWSELARGVSAPSLEIALRVLVDALTGLSAVHNLRDAKRQPLKLVHAGLTPDCIVVTSDGVARVLGASRLRSSMARPEPSAAGYCAPEVLLADDSADARADVYSIGVLLWEALSGRVLFPDAHPSAIVTHLLSGKIRTPTVPESIRWAAPLGEVAIRAMSADPGKRFASAVALATELRRISGAKMVPTVRVAAAVRSTFGDRIRARRQELECGDSLVREVLADAAPTFPSEEIAIEIEERSSRAPTPVPPAHVVEAAVAKTRPPLDPPPAVPERTANLGTPTPWVATVVANFQESSTSEPESSSLASESADLRLPVVQADSLAPAAAPRGQRPRTFVFALMGICLLILVAAIVRWLGSRTPDGSGGTPPAAAQPAGVSEPWPQPAQAMAPQPEPAPSPAPAKTPSAASRSAQPVAPAWTASPSWAPSPPAGAAKPRAVTKPNYDPQGI
jgi:serine/threonine-protein kinase